MKDNLWDHKRRNSETGGWFDVDPNKEKQIKDGEEYQKHNNEQYNSLSRIEKTDPKHFEKDIANAKESRPKEDKWRVSAYGAEHYVGSKCFVSNDGSTVAVTPDGDIVSVCTHKDSVRGTGKQLMQFAVKNGGRKLDSYDGNHGFYTKCGFEPVSYTKFNADFADGWKESGCPPEDVVFYKYVGVGNVKYMGDKGLEKFKSDADKNGWRFDGDDGYDNALKFRDDSMKGGK